jgi:hypothetical protein
VKGFNSAITTYTVEHNWSLLLQKFIFK